MAGLEILASWRLGVRSVKNRKWGVRRWGGGRQDSRVGAYGFAGRAKWVKEAWCAFLPAASLVALLWARLSGHSG